MSLLDEAVTKYNKLLESGPYRDLSWAEALHERMESRRALRGRTLDLSLSAPEFHLAPAVRIMVQTGEALIGAIDRMEQMVLANPALLARLELLPAEKMLASIDPGYQSLQVTARLDTHLVNGHLHFVRYNADSPSGAGYADALSNLFCDLPPVKEMRKKYTLTQDRQPQASAAGAAQVVQAVRRQARNRTSPSSNSGRPITPGKASTSCSAITSARKATPPKSFRRSSWNIATACCARARSKSI